MASRFWVGGTGTWDASDTTHWAASSNGAGGQSVPGSSDTVTFDGSSGGGTVTLDFGGTISIQSLTFGAFTGTIDNSVNNNNMTLSATVPFNGTGSGTRTMKMGSATYTATNNAASFGFSTVTNLTFQGSSSTVVFTGASGARTLVGGGQTWGTVTFGASSGAGIASVIGAPTIGTLNITAPNFVTFQFGVTATVGTALNAVGISGSAIGLASTSIGSTATIAAPASTDIDWASIRDLTFTGSPTADNSFNILNTSGITINAPSGAGGGISRARAMAGL